MPRKKYKQAEWLAMKGDETIEQRLKWRNLALDILQSYLQEYEDARKPKKWVKENMAQVEKFLNYAWSVMGLLTKEEYLKLKIILDEVKAGDGR